MDQSPRLSLSYLAPSQAQKHVTVNETFRRLDAMVQAVVRSRTQTQEPAGPAEGDAYILPAGASGAVWSGYDAGDIAVYQDGAWARIAPFEGARVWVCDEDVLVIHDGEGWGALTGGASETVSRLGVNTTADAVNRLSVKADAALFHYDSETPGSGDIRVKLNKQSAGKTASVLFQNNHSGRAEFGLTGDDKFHVKMSADGSTWKDVITVLADGKAGFGTNAPAADFEVNTSGNATDSSLLSADNILLAHQGSPSSFAGIVASNSGAHRMVFKGTRARGTLSSPAIVQSGDTTFSLLGTGYDGAQTLPTAGIEFKVDGAVSVGNVPQRITLLTNETNNRTERMRITAAGKVGIGETNPQALLHVDGGGVLVGNPSGGDKGAGTINATAVYDDNTLLSCYVFDQILDGSISTEKWDEKTPDRVIPADIEHRVNPATDETEMIERAPARIETRIHEPMRKFAARIGGDYDPLTLDGYARHWKEKRHLTSMPNEASYDPVNGKISAGEWIQRLIETVEIQAVLIEALNQRLKNIEKRPNLMRA